MTDTLLILDPAHGEDTPGKRSPDGIHREWQWSRARIHSIFYDFENAAKGFDVAIPFLSHKKEPGLRVRVDTYNQMAGQYKRTIMLSLHNDAFGDTWSQPHGFTIFTSRGETDADQYATTLGMEMKRLMPEEKWRFDFGLSKDELVKDLDREANFTVLAGYRTDPTKPATPENWTPTKYDGILIENNFMTNRGDIDKLMDPKWNARLESVYFAAIMKLMHGLGRAPEMIPEIEVNP